MKKFFTLINLLIFITGLSLAEPIDINKYRDFLSTYVNDNGYVNFQALKKDPYELYDFLDSCGLFTITEYNALNYKQKISFWINFYNAAIINIVLKKYPIKSNFFYSLIYPKNSIKQLGKLEKTRIFNRNISLPEIKNRLKEFDDPRVYFALTSLAKASPALKNTPYIWELLPVDLDNQLIKFIYKDYNYKLDKNIGVLYLSILFKKYRKLFKYNPKIAKHLNKEENGIVNFILKYVPENDKEFLKTGRYSIQYIDYDWELNDWEE